MSQVLVIEDEPNLRRLLVRLLEGAGYQVTAVGTGGEGLHAALSGEPDLVLLDLMLPDVAGEEVLHRLLSARATAKVVVLSSVPEVGRRIGVLNGGAVDFVGKPFVNAELLARIRLRLRDDPVAGAAVPPLTIGDDARLDMHRREFVLRGHRVALSQREFALLTHLIQRKGEVCSRQELLADIWGIGFDPGTNVVDVYVRRLRAKLVPYTIETVRNAGYRLAVG